MKRRDFWKFLAAAPVATISAPITAKPISAARAKILVGSGAVLHGCLVSDADIVIAPGADRWRITNNILRDVGITLPTERRNDQ